MPPGSALHALLSISSVCRGGSPPYSRRPSGACGSSRGSCGASSAPMVRACSALACESWTMVVSAASGLLSPPRAALACTRLDLAETRLAPPGHPSCHVRPTVLRRAATVRDGRLLERPPTRILYRFHRVLRRVCPSVSCPAQRPPSRPRPSPPPVRLVVGGPEGRRLSRPLPWGHVILPTGSAPVLDYPRGSWEHEKRPEFRARADELVDLGLGSLDFHGVKHSAPLWGSPPRPARGGLLRALLQQAVLLRKLQGAFRNLLGQLPALLNRINHRLWVRGLFRHAPDRLRCSSLDPYPASRYVYGSFR